MLEKITELKKQDGKDIVIWGSMTLAQSLCNKLGLTQDDLVRKCGVKHTTLTKIESNVVVKPSVQTVAKIAKALGVPMEDLVK